MSIARIITPWVLVVASALSLHPALAQQRGVRRTELQRHDLSVPGREVIQVRCEQAQVPG